MYSSVSSISRNKSTDHDKTLTDNRKSIGSDSCYKSDLDIVHNLRLKADENANSLRTLQHVASTTPFRSLKALQQHKMHEHRSRMVKVPVIYTPEVYKNSSLKINPIAIEKVDQSVGPTSPVSECTTQKFKSRHVRNATEVPSPGFQIPSIVVDVKKRNKKKRKLKLPLINMGNALNVKTHNMLLYS